IRDQRLVGLALLALLALSRPLNAQAPANALKNGGAETGSEQTIAGWTFTTNGLTPEQLSYGVSDKANEGKQSFYIALLKPVQANVWWAQEIPITPGMKSVQISLSAKRKTDDSLTKYGAPGVSCYFLDKANQWISWQSVCDVPESSDWVALGGVVTLPPGTVRMGIRLGVGCLGVMGVLFDDVRAIPSDTYLNMLANGDLEEGTATTVPGWTWKMNRAAETQFTYALTPDATEGKRAVRLASGDNSVTVHAYGAQVIPVVPGISAYQLSLKGKIREGAGDKQCDATAGYAFLDVKRRQIAYLPICLLTGKTWEDYSAKIMTPADAKYIEVRLCLDGAGVTEAFFDAVKLLPIP
ncbi:MAG TPA: hypothetical protein VGL77_01135, partial [Armatimonadota bacterium]